MSNGIKIALLVFVVLAVAAGFLVLSRNAPQPQPPFSSVVGPEIDSQFISFNGVKRYYEQMTLRTATSTVCALRPIDRATSTIDRLLAGITGAYLGANEFAWATSTDAFNATSTGHSLGFFTIASNALQSNAWTQASLNVSTTTGARVGVLPAVDSRGRATNILGANEWVVLKIATGTPGTGGYSGRCSGVFSKI